MKVGFVNGGGLRGLFVAGALLAASPAVAELLPRPEAIASPVELEALISLDRLQPGPQPSDLAYLDHALSKLRQATPLRGLVQFMRAQVFFGRGRHSEAYDAIEESVRLLPGYSGPLLLGSQIAAYHDRAEPAVAYLLRASRIDPQIVRGIPDYELGNLVSRIPQNSGSNLYRQLAERLFEIGWRGEGLLLRSSIARELIAARVEAGALEGARALLPHLVDPRHAQWLLMQKRYEPIWQAVADWGGNVQERLWPNLLTELRERWVVSRDQDHARSYVAALSVANRHQQIVNDFLPLFSNPDAERDYKLLWLASPLASSLAQLGRWDEVERMFSKALTVWPAGSDANALNLLANRGRFRYLRGNFAGAVADLRAAIEDGERRSGEVSAHALAPMHYFLACSLHELGRRAEAERSIPFILENASSRLAANLYLCLGRKDDARRVLIAALAIEPQRDDVIEYLQLENGPPMPSEVARAAASRRRALAEDPEIIAAVAPYGRVLPYQAGAGANAAAKPRN